jgi:hypothetical protein
MFTVTRHYRATPDSVDEVVWRVKDSFVNVMRDTLGFMSYFVLWRPAIRRARSFRWASSGTKRTLKRVI